MIVNNVGGPPEYNAQQSLYSQETNVLVPAMKPFSIADASYVNEVYILFLFLLQQRLTTEL